MKCNGTLSIATMAFVVLILTACRQKTVPNERQDKQFIQYQRYRDIYNQFDAVPLDTTRSRLEAFLQLFPEDARAWAFYGNVLFKQQDVERATMAYRKVIACNPRYSTGYAALGAVFLNLGRQDSAEFYLLRALEKRDSSAYTTLNLALLYQEQHQPDKALAYADTTRLKNDSAVVISAGLAYVYSITGHRLLADTLYRMAVAGGLSDTVGLASVLKGDLKLKDFYRQNKY